MKNILFLFLALFCINLSSMAADTTFDDIDFNFIDTAFDGIKPVTNKEFNDTINRLNPKPVEETSIGGKIRSFLFGKRYEPQAQTNIPAQDIKIDIGGEKKAIEDIKNGVYYIKLIASVISADNSIIPAGNYKIKEELTDNEPMLVFYQGTKEYGKLKLKKYEDTKKDDNTISYSRVDIVSDNIIRIVYATIKDTKCAVARVY